MALASGKNAIHWPETLALLKRLGFDGLPPRTAGVVITFPVRDAVTVTFTQLASDSQSPEQADNGGYIFPSREARDRYEAAVETAARSRRAEVGPSPTAGLDNVIPPELAPEITRLNDGTRIVRLPIGVTLMNPDAAPVETATAALVRQRLCPNCFDQRLASDEVSLKCPKCGRRYHADPPPFTPAHYDRESRLYTYREHTFTELHAGHGCTRCGTGYAVVQAAYDTLPCKD